MTFGPKPFTKLAEEGLNAENQWSFRNLVNIVVDTFLAQKTMSKKTIKICKDKNCKNEQTTMGYCRFHYLINWKTIQEKQKKRATKSLNRYVDHIMKRNPDNYVDAIKGDLSNENKFRQRASSFMGDDNYHDIMEDVESTETAERVAGGLKIDENF